jgi:hypothetical protein
MLGAGRGSQASAETQQARLSVTGFEFDSFSVNSFHRLRIKLSAWHTHGACLGRVAEKYKQSQRGSSWWN